MAGAGGGNAPGIRAWLVGRQQVNARVAAGEVGPPVFQGLQS